MSMLPNIIFLNGASSSGKTTLARALQSELPGEWLTFGIDDLVRALPPRLLMGDGIEFGSGGEVKVGPAFARLERAWMQGIAATATAGASLIVDDVLLGGVSGQQRWREALGPLDTFWVGVTCDPDAAEARERQRPDRTPGMHHQQATRVHSGMVYDLTVDTSRHAPGELARLVARAIARRVPTATLENDD